MNQREQELHTICKMLCDAMTEEMNDARTGPPIGFAILLFDEMFVAYGSNSDRRMVIKILRAYADRLEQKLNAKD